MYYSVDALRYHQGGRTMYALVTSPEAAHKMSRPPEVWDPLGAQPHGNRPHDKRHRAAIQRYLVEESDPIIGAVVLYCGEDDVEFSHQGASADGAIVSGTLKINAGAELDVGDGQHRLAAVGDIISEYDDPETPVRKRLQGMGLPVIIVPESFGQRRAQDYADLQINVKPPTGSLGMSMDRRHPFNRFVLQLVEDNDLQLFQKGQAVDFLRDSPGKGSAKFASFRTIHAVTATLLVGGFGATKIKRQTAADAFVEKNEELSQQVSFAFWKGMESIPPLDQVVAGAMTMAELRATSYLGSAGFLFTIAQSAHLAHFDDGASIELVLKRLAGVDFTRVEHKVEEARRKPADDRPWTSDDSIFVGLMINPFNGKISTGRQAVVAAAEELRKMINTDG